MSVAPPGQPDRSSGAVLVVLQFSLLVLLAYWVIGSGRLGRPSAFELSLVLAGTALGAWALSANRPGNFNIRPLPKTGATLVQHGPYRWIRHPMYTSLLIAGMGAALWAGHAGAWLTLAALAIVLAAKAAAEERGLIGQYPAYRDYQQRSWRFFPGVY